jgi:exonuclease III
MDGFSVTPPDIHGNNHMHVVINMFTKHVFLFVCKDKTAITGANALVTYMALFGRHDSLMTDPGSDYKSEVVNQLNQYLSFTHRFSLVDRHESNGTEPTNRELKRHIQAMVFDLNLRDRWSEPHVLALITMEINSNRSSESGFSAFDLLFGTKSREYFTNLGAESLSPIDRYSDYIRELDQDIARMREISRQFQFKLAERRATDISVPRNHWQPGDYVLLDNLDPAHKLQAPRLGPFKVVKHVQNKNEVFLENLVDGNVKPFFVGRLSLYTGTIKEALKGARADRDQHLIERFSAYRGDVDTRQTLEFRVEFTDGDVVWKPFDQDLAGTAQLESYCVSLPQLRPLLISASEAAKQRSALSKLPTADTHPEGTIIYVDMRSRRIFEPEFYLALVLPDKDIRPRYVELVVGKNVAVRGTRKGSRVELIDKAYGLAHVVDNYFLHVNGTVRCIQDLPADSEVIDAAFARAYPYDPINTAAHRRLVRRDLGVITPPADTLRVWSCNVNGIFSALQKGLAAELQGMPGGSPDVLLMQETKAHPSEEARLERTFASFGYKFFCLVSGAQSQYQGVAVASKTQFTLLGNAPTERGRALAIRIFGIIITNLYAPIVCSHQDDMIQRRVDFDEPIVEWIRSRSPDLQLVCVDLNAFQDIAMDLEVPMRMQRSFSRRLPVQVRATLSRRTPSNGVHRHLPLSQPVRASVYMLSARHVETHEGAHRFHSGE